MVVTASFNLNLKFILCKYTISLILILYQVKSFKHYVLKWIRSQHHSGDSFDALRSLDLNRSET